MTKISSIGLTAGMGQPTLVVPNSNREALHDFFGIAGVQYTLKTLYAPEDGDAFDRLAKRATFRYHPDEIHRGFVVKQQEDDPEIFLDPETRVEVMSGVMPGLAIALINDTVGYGCFAQRDVACGAVVGVYTGWLVDFRRAYHHKSPYLLNIGGCLYIDGRDAGNETRFINHGESDNAVTLPDGSEVRADNISTLHVYCDGTEQCALYANRDIRAGEELRWNYGQRYRFENGPDRGAFFLWNDRLFPLPSRTQLAAD